MKEHPIIFSTQMVKVILDGRKTQTRRLVKPQPISLNPYLKYTLPPSKYEINVGTKRNSQWISCPYGKVKDRLWVRETWWMGQKDYEYKSKEWIIYRATAINENDPELKWQPSIHMPRWASRITLEIANIKVERLQEIENIDFIREGYSTKDEVYIEYHKYKHAKKWFINLWNSLHKKQYSWEDNCWVWVISFKRTK